MYKFIVVSVIALVILQGVSAKPKKAAPAEKSQIDEMAGQLRQVVKNVSLAIDGNLPESQQVAQTLTESTQTLATKINSIVDDLAKQTSEHKGDIANTLDTVKGNLKTLADKLQASIGPEATEKAKDLKKNLDEGFNKAITEVQRLAKAAEPEIGKVQSDWNEAAKNLLNNFSDVAKSLKANLDKIEKDSKPKN